MSLDFKYLQNACHAVMIMGKAANWRFKALPVLTWEFATVHDYVAARHDLLRCIDKSMLSMRQLTSEIEEFDCYGVSIRFVCKEKVMSQRGPLGAADLKEIRDYKLAPWHNLNPYRPKKP